jgi:thymidylate kinase
VLDLLERFAGAPRPDLVIVLDLSAEVARGRRARNPRARRTGSRTRESGSSRRSPRDSGATSRALSRAVLVDASRPEDDVAASVLLEVRRAL